MKRNVMRFAGVALVALSGTLLADEMADGFAQPPPEARPQVWWHWMNGNVTREGIRADLEAMARVGIGGAQIFDIGGCLPRGVVRFGSSDWYDAVSYAASEARRLGLELTVSNCSGWSSSGGPWIPPELSMKEVVWQEKLVSGGERIAFDPPSDTHGFYRDVVVLAFPTPSADLVTFQDKWCVRSSVSPRQVEFSVAGAAAVSGFTSRLEMPRRTWLGTARYVTEAFSGGTWSTVGTNVCKFALRGNKVTGEVFFPFKKPVVCSRIRIVFDPFWTWPGDVKDEVKVADMRLEKSARLSNIRGKAFFDRLPVVADDYETNPDQVVNQERIIELASALRSDGSLDWTAPPGRWTVMRIGCRATGRTNHPASETGRGLEVDKLSPAAMSFHLDQYVGRLCKELGPSAVDGVKGLAGVLVDSFEVGAQNWTDELPSEFRRRTGYSLVPFLPTFAGHVVGSVNQSERFLYDFRKVVSELFAEASAKTLAEKCHSLGLRLHLEPYGNCPSDDLEYGRFADVPMCEFWGGSGRDPYAVNIGNAPYVASLAHVWGQRIVASESFTNGAGDWNNYPFCYKAQGDAAYASGVNRIIFHRFAHQPWTNPAYRPGMTMSKWGCAFDRTQTWWEQSGPWLTYMARCQYLLQRGTPVRQVLFWAGEDVPNGGEAELLDRRLHPSAPRGYSFDWCSRSAVKALGVRNGRIVAPSGVEYAYLGLPDTDAMSEEMLFEVERLVRAGACLLAKKQPVRCLGLHGYPCADGRLGTRAAEIWRRGVVTCDPSEGVRKLGLEPDFTCLDASVSDRIRFIHRRDETADWYFVALANRELKEVEVSFLVADRIPELWDAETGEMQEALKWKRSGCRTSVTIPFRPSGSMFVVFRRSARGRTQSQAAARVRTNQLALLPGPWRLVFPSESGASDCRIEKLRDLSRFEDEAIRHFSGTATYEFVGDVQVPVLRSEERIVLDLGEVHEIAEVSVNGKTYPPLWRPPFRIDVTEALAGTRTLRLSVKVTNLWPNRLIGDAALPEDCAWKKADVGRSLLRIPDFVIRNEKSPSGRRTFATWDHWKADDNLLPSGLIGPVRLDSVWQEGRRPLRSNP